jgi:hypothetical protein
MFIKKTQLEIDAMTPEVAEAYFVQKEANEALMQKEAIETAVKAVKEELGVQIATLKENNTELALKVTSVETKSNENIKETFIDVVKANRASIDKATKEKGNGAETEFVVKADTVRASVVGNGYALDLRNVGQLATRRLTVYDLFPKVPMPKNANGVVRYIDWDEATKVRAAAAVAEGAVIPESTAKWATYTLPIQKVGDTIPVSEEFAYDDEMFVAEVGQFLTNNVDLKIDGDLINGNGTTPNIKGIVAQSTAYTAVASGITDASIYDLIVDVKRSITVGGGSKYMPDFALMNITDINKMLLKKDVNKQYVAPPFSQGGNGVAEFIVSGVRVIECNAITANTMVLGDSRYAKIYEEPGYTVGVGYDGADWSSDMMTLKARKRLNLLVRTVDQTGFAKVASISAALTLLAT